MEKPIRLSHIIVGIRSGGDLGSGVAWRLHRCGFRVFITETFEPLAVRRKVAFSEAVYDGSARVEGVEAVRVEDPGAAVSIWERGAIPLFVDPEFSLGPRLAPRVMVDAILAKKNLGTTKDHAPLVIALGPGFEAGKDAHFVVETNRGHHLGRVLASGSAEPDTGVPGTVLGVAAERVIRAPATGTWRTSMEIGDGIRRREVVGEVAGVPVPAAIDGVIRGLIRSGIQVSQGLKIGDIDPRGIREHCFSISEKALAVAGGVLEAILSTLSA